MKKILTNPLFTAGLLLRLVMIICIVPQAAALWYVPFLDVTSQHFTLDPWQTFLSSGGNDIAFPYGYAMWLIFLPLTKLSSLLSLPPYTGYGLTLLVADVALLFVLRSLFTITDRLLLTAYWLSPIVLFATYWLGLNDLIPVTLLCIALYFVRTLKPFKAGIFCSLAVSAKLSMLLPIPFFMIYLFRNRPLRRLLPHYLLGIAITVAAFGLPFMLSSSGLFMLTHNPEMDKVYQLTLQIGDSVLVYLLPMTYLLMLYLAWQMRRINFELLTTLLGLSFFLVVLLTPASPGWFIWIMPLLLLYQHLRGRVASMLVAGFTTLYVVTSLLAMPLPLFKGVPVEYFSTAIPIMKMWLGQRGIAFAHTILLTFGVILVMRIWREMVRNNDYFRLSRKPFIIGIAGDSGAGKDTLAASLQGLFGSHSVTSLSGDDYHYWDRQKPIWQAITHLNPQANDLEQYTQDLIALADGKSIQVRHYNHHNGKMMRPQRTESNDFIITSGLHALYLPTLRSCHDLSIYLDIDESLRRYFKLQRDVYDRGHKVENVLFSLDRRETDAKKFVRPQAAHADLVLSLQPIHPRLLEKMDPKISPRLKLFVCSRRGLYEESLLRTLIGICGLHVDMKINTDNNEVELVIEGETTADDIALAAKSLLPRIHEFLDTIPRWEDGIKGLMQLIILSHINQSLRERLIWQNS